MRPVFFDLSPRDRDTLVRVLSELQEQITTLKSRWVDVSGQQIYNAPSAQVGGGLTTLSQVNALITAAVDSAVQRLKDDNDLE